MQMTTPALPPTNLQRELLALFSLELTESELQELRQLLLRHYAGKLAEQAETYLEEQGVTPAQSDRWAYEHNRTPYRR